MILAAGLLAALALAALAPLLRRRGPRLRLRWAIVPVPFAWAAFFGIFRAVAYLTQRDLPGTVFATPWVFYAGASVPLALAVGAFLAGRLRIPALIVAEGALLVACCALNYHCCVTPDAILLRRCLSFTERRYEYRQVRSLRYVVDWKLLFWDLHRPRFVIAFDDGSRWTSDDGFRRTVAHVDVEAIRLVSSRSDRMLQQTQQE